MDNFWNDLKAPFFALAPMEDVTDTVFREIVMSVSSQEVLKVVFTEFTSTDGLMDSRGFERVSERFIVNESEIEILKKNKIKLVAQIWGNEPEKFFKTAQLVNEMNLFDGIDINMGCPVKKVVKKNTCSALIKFPELAAEIIDATKKGSSLPVSVKTRIGFNEVVTEEWIGHLLNTDIAALTIHGRTQKMQSEGYADWNEIGKAVSLRNKIGKETLILGNGDVDSYEDGIHKVRKTGVEGIMVGRGIFKNPWMFNHNLPELSIDDRLNLMQEHIELYEKTWGGKKNFNVLKRFFKIYVSNFGGAGKMRADLMETKNYADALKLRKQFSSSIAV